MHVDPAGTSKYPGETLELVSLVEEPRVVHSAHPTAAARPLAMKAKALRGGRTERVAQLETGRAARLVALLQLGFLPVACAVHSAHDRQTVSTVVGPSGPSRMTSIGISCPCGRPPPPPPPRPPTPFT